MLVVVLVQMSGRSDSLQARVLPNMSFCCCCHRLDCADKVYSSSSSAIETSGNGNSSAGVRYPMSHCQAVWDILPPTACDTHACERTRTPTNNFRSKLAAPSAWRTSGCRTLGTVTCGRPRSIHPAIHWWSGDPFTELHVMFT